MTRQAWRLWRIVQRKDDIQIVVWESPDGDADFARQQFAQYVAFAPQTVSTALQFQDPPEPPPWETVSFKAAKDEVDPFATGASSPKERT